MKKPRISYIDPATTDAAMQAEFARCATRRHAAAGKPGGPRPRAGGVLVVRQHLARHLPHRHRRPRHQGAVPALCVALGDVRVLRQPALDEGGQRRRGGRGPRQGPDQLRDLDRSYDEKQKAALSYAEAITWDLPVDDKFWARLHKHFSEPELVEIGYFIAITMGQQRWLRTLDIEHHQVLVGESGSMAPGFETEDALKRSKADPTTGRTRSPRARPRRRSSLAAPSSS